ncbi:MAG: toll/interleukin-1 receptor domain-containing protein [Terricaulis sp.]
MATALIIHAPEDALPARALAEKLRAAKLTVVLEKAAGDEVREAAKTAQVTVALWSPRSVGSAGLIDDVAFARGKTKLVHAQMQNAQTPQQFASDKSVNLTGWRGEDEFAPWRELANAITERAGVAPLPPPAPRPPSGFFTPGTPGRDGAPSAAPAAASAPPPRPSNPGQAAPPPRAAAPRAVPPAPPRAPAPPPPRADRPPPGVDLDEPKKGGGMGIVLVIVALVVVLGGGAAGYMWWQGQQASHASSAAFDQIDRNDPGALRAFIAANNGPAKQQAEGALTELEERSYEAASDADTIEALQGFLKDFPQSSHALAARGRIAELQANPEQGADTTTTPGADQPETGDQVAPGGAPTTATTTTTAPAGAPVQLSPAPSEPSTSTEPPSATTTP